MNTKVLHKIAAIITFVWCFAYFVYTIWTFSSTPIFWLKTLSLVFALGVNILLIIKELRKRILTTISCAIIFDFLLLAMPFVFDPIYMGLIMGISISVAIVLLVVSLIFHPWSHVHIVSKSDLHFLLGIFHVITEDFVVNPKLGIYAENDEKKRAIRELKARYRAKEIDYKTYLELQDLLTNIIDNSVKKEKEIRNDFLGE
jgi:hypothetical protein